MWRCVEGDPEHRTRSSWKSGNQLCVYVLITEYRTKIQNYTVELFCWCIVSGEPWLAFPTEKLMPMYYFMGVWRSITKVCAHSE